MSKSIPSEESITASVTTYAFMGDTVNVVVLIASLVYAWVVIYFTQTGTPSGILDEEWRKDGFCITNIDVPYLSSFDTCLYVDSFFSLLLGLMYLFWRNLPGMGSSSDLVPMVIMSTLAHGMAHGAMAAQFRDGSYQRGTATGTEEIPPLWALFLFSVLFWFPLLKATMPKIQNLYVFGIAAVVTFGPLFAGGLKREFRFAFVQTIVSMAFHTSQLMLSPDEKNCREYLTLPLCSVLPIVISWSEALFCSTFFRSLGGHVLYDGSIIISYIVFYVDCYRVNVLSPKPSSLMTKKQKKT